MSDPIQDPYEFYPNKDNDWFKNNVAHKRAKAKREKSNQFCTYCMHHHCGDPTKVYGKRSLKKSKVIQYAKTKYADKLVIMPDFVSIMNGETKLED